MAKKKAAKKKSTKKRSAPKTKAKRPAPPPSLGTCFVMMPFREPFSIYYETIFESAITKANLKPVKTDDLFRPSVIVSDLWQMIQDAKLLLAELTTKNANVFYELGLAHAIGKPVILVSETMDDVPFDLQQLRVLLYDKNDPAWGKKLSADITSAITETLANPIDAVPSIFRKIVKSQAPAQDETLARLENLESQIRSLSEHSQIIGPSKLNWEEELKITPLSRLPQWEEKWISIVPPNLLRISIRNNFSKVQIKNIQVFFRKVGFLSKLFY